MNWKDLSLNEKSELMKLYLQNGITSLSAMKEHYNSFQAGGPVSSKIPNFVQRFKEGNKRDIPVKDGFATHLLGYAERDGRYYVYPDVQPTDYNDSNSPLQYYGRDWRVAFDRAYDNNDYLEFDTEEAARNYTENYKKVPSTGAVLNGRNRGNYNILDYIRGYQNGGPIKPNKIGYSAPPVDSSLEGVSMETPFYRPNNPEYIKYWETLPDNQKYTSNDEYDSYLYWQLNGKPRHFQEAKRKGMFTWDSSDNSYHGNSIAYDEKGNGRFIKPKKHDTVKYELDWYNKGLITEEGGVQRRMTPKEKAEWENFRKEYELVDDPERPNFYMYRRRHSNDGYLFPDVGSLGKITPYGQWQYPHQVTTIPSNNITMKGVNYPVIGVSNTGDTKYMLPNLNYKFDGSYVTEYPVNSYQYGGNVDDVKYSFLRREPQTAISDNTRVSLQPTNLFEEQFQRALQAEEEAKAQAEFERRQARRAKNEAEVRAREAEKRAKTPAILREPTTAEKVASHSQIKVTTPINTGVIYDKTRAELEEQAANWGRSVGSVATMTPEMVSRNPLTAVALGGLGEMAFLSGRYPFTNFRQTLSTAGELLSPSTYTELLGASPVVGNLANTALGADIAYHSIQDLPEAAESFRLNNDLGSGLRTGLDLLGVSPLYSMGKAGVGLVGDAANTVKPYFKNVSRYDHRNIFQKLLGKPIGEPYIEDEFTINMDRWLKSPREYKLQSEFNDKKALRNEAVYNLGHGDIGEVKIPYDQSAATKIESSVFNPTMSDFSVFVDGKRIHGTTKNLSTEIVSPIDYSQQAINTIGHPISIQDPKVPNIIRNNNGYVFPIENNPEFTTELAKHIQELEAKGYPVVGSSRVISKGYIGGQPGDVEIIAPATDRAVYDSFGFSKQRSTRGGTGVTGRSPLVMESAESNNLDINLLDDSGTIIHQLESTRMPEKMPSIYSREARKASTQLGEPTLSRDLRIPKDTGDGTYKAQEYFDLVKNDEKLLDQSVIDNMFKADSDKAFQRAYVMMNNSDPRSIELTTTAIDHMHKQIPGMKKFSELYPSEKFENVEHNKEILKKIGFTPFDIEKFASNPKQMRNIVDYWYMRKYVGGRSVNFDSTKNLSFDEAMIPLRQLDNMSTAGGGGNFVSGSKHGGFVRNYTSYVNYEPIVENKATATFDDVFNAFERERTVFKDEDKVKGAIEKVLKNTDLKLTDFRRFDSRFTDDVMDLVNAGRISNQEGDMIIQKVAEELGVSGFRGTRYNDYGDYFGGMQRSANYIGQKGSPKVAFRSVDAGEKDVVLPAEWGTDKMFNLMSSDNAKLITDFSSEYPVLSFEELKRTVPQAVEDYRFPITKNDVKTYFIDKTNPYFQEELNKTLESLPENSDKLWEFVLNNRYRMHNGLNDIPVAPELEAKIARVVKEDASKVARQNMLYDKKQQAFKDYYKRVKTLKNVGIYGGIGVGSIGAGIGGHDLLATIINNNEKADWELANINELDEMVKKEIGPAPDSDAPDKEWKDYLKKEKAIYNREYKKYKNASSKLHNMTINSDDSY